MPFWNPIWRARALAKRTDEWAGGRMDACGEWSRKLPHSFVGLHCKSRRAKAAVANNDLSLGLSWSKVFLVVRI